MQAMEDKPGNEATLFWEGLYINSRFDHDLSTTPQQLALLFWEQNVKDLRIVLDKVNFKTLSDKVWEIIKIPPVGIWEYDTVHFCSLSLQEKTQSLSPGTQIVSRLVYEIAGNSMYLQQWLTAHELYRTYFLHQWFSL